MRQLKKMNSLPVADHLSVSPIISYRTRVHLLHRCTLIHQRFTKAVLSISSSLPPARQTFIFACFLGYCYIAAYALENKIRTNVAKIRVFNIVIVTAESCSHSVSDCVFAQTHVCDYIYNREFVSVCVRSLSATLMR